MSTNHNFWKERRAEAVSNRGPSAYQPTALPLGQTGSLTNVSALWAFCKFELFSLYNMRTHALHDTLYFCSFDKGRDSRRTGYVPVTAAVVCRLSDGRFAWLKTLRWDPSVPGFVCGPSVTLRIDPLPTKQQTLLWRQRINKLRVSGWWSQGLHRLSLNECELVLTRPCKIFMKWSACL